MLGIINVCRYIPVVFWITDFVQVLKELVESVLLQPDVHFERVIRGRSPDFNPAFGNVDPFMFHLQLLPTFVGVELFRDGRLEGTKHGNGPE